jgi:hypothetical protein
LAPWSCAPRWRCSSRSSMTSRRGSWLCFPWRSTYRKKGFERNLCFGLICRPVYAHIYMEAKARDSLDLDPNLSRRALTLNWKEPWYIWHAWKKKKKKNWQASRVQILDPAGRTRARSRRPEVALYHVHQMHTTKQRT